MPIIRRNIEVQMEEKRSPKNADVSSSSDVEGGYQGRGSQIRKSGILANKASSSRVSFSYMNDEQGEELKNKFLPERKKTCKVKIAVKTASGSTRILLSSKSSIFVDLVEYGEENDNEKCASKSATVTEDGNHGVAVVVPNSQGDENCCSCSQIEESEHFQNLLNQPDEDLQGEVDKEDGEEEGPTLSNFSAGTQESHIPGNQASSFDGQNEEEIDTSSTPRIILKRKSSTSMIDSSITKTGKQAQISNPAEAASVPSFRKRKWGSIKYYTCQKCPESASYAEHIQEHVKLHDGNDPSIIACEIFLSTFLCRQKNWKNIDTDATQAIQGSQNRTPIIDQDKRKCGPVCNKFFLKNKKIIEQRSSKSGWKKIIYIYKYKYKVEVL